MVFIAVPATETIFKSDCLIQEWLPQWQHFMLMCQWKWSLHHSLWKPCKVFKVGIRQISGLVQDCSNSSALAMELLQSWAYPSKFTYNKGAIWWLTSWICMMPDWPPEYVWCLIDLLNMYDAWCNSCVNNSIGISMVIADVLVSNRCQDIWCHHDDINCSMHVKNTPQKLFSSRFFSLNFCNVVYDILTVTTSLC